MSKRNHFSTLYETKDSSELRAIIEQSGYQNQAKLAAIWELERRGESQDQYLKEAEVLLANESPQSDQKTRPEKYQTFWPRFIATIIDWIVLWPLLALMEDLNDSQLIWVANVSDMLGNFSPFVYSIWMHGKFGQTLGKMAMKVKVFDVAEQHGISMKQAFYRDMVPVIILALMYLYIYLFLDVNNENFIANIDLQSILVIWILGTLYLCWPALEIVSMAFSSRYRAIHDLIARTVVIRTDIVKV